MILSLAFYVHCIEYNGGTLLFNYDGGGLAYLPFSLSNNAIDSSMLSDAEIQSLIDMKMLSHIDCLDSSLRDTDTLHITIELTDLCNYSCAYCYQQPWEKHGTIDFNTIESILRYIENYLDITNKTSQHIRRLQLNFIGGEPLLEQDKLVLIYHRISMICSSHNIHLYVHIDTNGSLLSNELLTSITDELFLSITLSSKKDHNSLRRGSVLLDSYDRTLEKLQMITESHLKSVRTSIRYNTHHNNISEFQSFVESISKSGLCIDEIVPMYIRNVPGCSFINKLSPLEFVTWNSTEAIDILIINGFKISYYPQVQLKLCKAYQSGSYKFFSDGSIGVCDATDYIRNMPNINDYCDRTPEIEQIFKGYKTYTPINDKKCSSCKKLIGCGGAYFCKENPCLNSRYDDLLFIKTFARYIDMGKGEFFTITKSAEC
ncbi:MAG: 4Fe-4S cluster-binding domain-containing protein [Clostridiaceae bacterium]|jgi:uncharacterized protein|nr:4Fe-4S cluster-binding domain-containing protein [Clostridiaceae bacterium]